ncbi:hypothetical protein tb265_48110 [Gemmatimonadetes bacterium T265]|nr:hypothetical protein tb265_48110 [Gemmatimonadetes bacterium T265]
MIAVEVGMFGWMALLYFVVRPRVEANQVEYWFLIQLGMVLGFATSDPANGWLIKCGIKERM